MKQHCADNKKKLIILLFPMIVLFAADSRSEARIVRCFNSIHTFSALCIRVDTAVIGTKGGWIYDISTDSGHVLIHDSETIGSYTGTIIFADVDSEGIVWIASDYGIFSYDGQAWTRYKRPAGIYVESEEYAHDRVTSMRIDAHDNVYVAINGTANYGQSYHYPDMRVDNGIVRFDGTAWSFILGQRDLTFGSTETKYQGLTTDKNNVLWYKKGRTLSFYSDETGEDSIAFQPGAAYPDIREMAFDANGILWCSSPRYPWSFDGETWTQYENKGMFAATEMAIESDKRLWFGGERGIVSGDGYSWHEYNTDDGIPDNAAIQDIKIDRAGTVWALSDIGLYRFNGQRFETYALSGIPTENAIPENPSGNIASMSVSGERVWFATDLGIGGFDGESWVYLNHDKDERLPWNKTGAVFVDNTNTTWITTERGIACIKDETATVIQTPYNERFFIRILGDNNNVLWLLYRDQYSVSLLVSLDAGISKERFRWSYNSWGDYAFDCNGIPWVTANGELLKFNGDTFVTDISMPSPVIRMAGGNGVLWSVTRQGFIYRYDSGEWIHHASLPSSVAGMTPEGITVDSKGNLWLVFNGRAVIRCDSSDFSMQTEMSETLLTGWNTLKSIAFDKNGALWFDSDTGVFCWTPEFGVTNVEESSASSLASVILHLAPNPFNASTTIAYTLPTAANVKLSVYTVSGQKVATLVDGFMSAGNHAAVFDGSALASGVYFYRLETKGFAKTGKMVLVK